MPNNFPAKIEIEEYEETEDYGPDDFSFVLGPEGELKSFSVPQHLMTDPPEEVMAILSLFGIDNIHDLGTPTLH